jgi:anaerobic magnesium-protoporphyrin IX monomethyl ester cyclase
MNLYLFSMPLGDLTQPYTSLPSLTGHLRPRGINVTQRDFGIDFAHYWAHPDRFPKLCEGLSNAVLEVEERPVTTGEWEDYVDLKILERQIAPFKDCLYASLKQLQAPEIVEDVWTLSKLLRLMTAYQSLLSFTERQAFFPMATFQALSREGGVSAIEHPPELYGRFLSEFMLPKIKEAAPDLIGITITYPKMLYPSLVACAALKRSFPQVPIVLGGAYFSTVAETIHERPELQPYWDFAINGEGETALTRLLEVLDGGGAGGSLAEVPNLIYQEEGAVRRSVKHHDEDLPALNTPDFRGLNLEEYFAPQTVFLLPVARGCYMRCTFCAVSYATQVYRCRSGEQIVQDIKTLQEQFGVERARHFSFSIDVMAPKHLNQMAQALYDAKLDVVWDAEIRFERSLRSEIISLMAASGCRHLRFGLESASDRILGLMDKHIDIKRVREILEDCRREGIKASTMVIIGFPGETEAEATETFRFIYDNNDKIRFYTLHVYTVSRGSIIEHRPEDFGVQVTLRDDRLIQPSWDFKILRGIPTARARELAGEFRLKLLERYPLADEGFSVGIGGAFTFLVSARWKWEDLLRFDAEDLAQTTAAKKMLDSTSVPNISPRTVTFDSPFSFNGETLRRSPEAITYLVTARHNVVRMDGESAEVIRCVDGRRSIQEISRLLAAEADEQALEELCAFFSQLGTRDIVTWT